MAYLSLQLEPGPYYCLLLLASFLFVAIIKLGKYLARRRSSHVAQLRGPPSTSFLKGRLRESLFTDDPGSLVEQWAREYGSVFKVSRGLGMNNVVHLRDPKAIAHFHDNDRSTYLRPQFLSAFLEAIMGNTMMSAEKDDHKRQRRIMSPAFSSNNLRGILNVFYDSGYKMKVNWDQLFETSDEATIDVQEWMDRLTLDSIGIAGFGHDFKALDGHKSAITNAFETLNKPMGDPETLTTYVIIGTLFPSIVKLPTKQTKIFNVLKDALSDIAAELLQGPGTESGDIKDRSILGLLLKGQSGADVKISHDEVIGQGLFIFAGYEATSISLSWALIELSRNKHMQEKLRDELRQFSGSDPTWEQLMSGLPYLDAVIHETLRLHPPVEEISREASDDDVLPLSHPLKLASGEVVNALSIPKGTIVVSPIVCINTSEEFWGPNAKEFVPDRWLSGDPCRTKGLQGHRHLYTFSDGPRMCLGKTALSVLIRNFSFELPNGPETKISLHKGPLLPRPKFDGEESTFLPLRVQQIS